MTDSDEQSTDKVVIELYCSKCDDIDLEVVLSPPDETALEKVYDAISDLADYHMSVRPVGHSPAWVISGVTD